jgi:hypothetical protein
VLQKAQIERLKWNNKKAGLPLVTTGFLLSNQSAKMLQKSTHWILIESKTKWYA